MTGLRLRMAAVLALAALTLAGLVAAGSGTLAAPPTGSWASAVAWYEQVGAERAAVAALRLLAMVGVAWLLLGATLQLVASVSLRHEMQRVANALSPAVLRRVAHGVASLSVTAGLGVPSAPTTLLDDPPGTAVMQVLEEDAEPTTANAPTTTTTTTAPTTTTTLPPAPPATAPAAIPVPAPRRAAVDEEVVVEAGDSFWRLAVDVIAEARGGVPGDREVVEYWQRLIAANRSRLVDAANPDLLFPGQTLLLPAP